MGGTVDADFSERERAQIDEANASPGPAVVLIHGLWCVADAWVPWQERLASSGFASVAAAWPREPETFEAALADPDAVAGVGVQEAADRIAALVGALDTPPFLVGHSFGGLLAQKIAAGGLARATVAIAPAPIRGVNVLPAAVLRASSPVLGNPRNRQRAVRLTYRQFAYAWGNRLSEEESRRLWRTVHVAAPALPLFQAASARFSARSETAIEVLAPDRGPLLVIASGDDHLVAAPISRATYALQRRNPHPTELVELPGRGHSLILDHGWGDVADLTVDFLRRHAAAR